ncbi:MAG: division/cell wall cluster transcriptional repressor MraZ [Lachnospiraceae bacterium]|nr:division/cell wall cluster transcriptional repressor MraZ [Lachnospiraceae bacterium]
MFEGQYNHTIDVKGRLSIPAKFREQLGDEFYVTRGMDGCLFVYDNENWIAFEKSLMSLPKFNSKDLRNLRRIFISGAACVEVDKQGRILIPAALRESAGLEKDVVLAGVGDCIEIWSQERWDGLDLNTDNDNISDAMERLGITM